MKQSSAGGHPKKEIEAPEFDKKDIVYRSKVKIMGNVFENQYGFIKGTYQMDVGPKILRFSNGKGNPICIKRESVRQLKSSPDHIGMELSRTAPFKGGTLCLYTEDITKVDIEVRKCFGFSNKTSKATDSAKKEAQPRTCRCFEENGLESHENPKGTRNPEDCGRRRSFRAKTPPPETPINGENSNPQTLIQTSKKAQSTNGGSRFLNWIKRKKTPRKNKSEPDIDEDIYDLPEPDESGDDASLARSEFRLYHRTRDSTEYDPEPDESGDDTSLARSEVKWHNRTRDATEYDCDMKIPLELQEDGIHVAVLDTHDLYTLAAQGEGSLDESLGDGDEEAKKKILK